MAKLILYVNGKPLLHGFHRHEFKWSQPLGCYIYEGKTLTESEFNAIADKVLRGYPDMNPSARIVEMSPTVPAVAPVSTISASREITVDEAEAVLKRLAPEMLKMKPGRKPIHAVA